MLRLHKNSHCATTFRLASLDSIVENTIDLPILLDNRTQVAKLISQQYLSSITKFALHIPFFNYYLKPRNSKFCLHNINLTFIHSPIWIYTNNYSRNKSIKGLTFGWEIQSNIV